MTGTRKKMCFAVAKVNKPLGSVGCMCDAGYEVVFNDRTGSYIKDLDGDEYIPFRKENGVYVMDAWVQPPDSGGRDIAACGDAAGDSAMDADAESGFSRPERTR